MKDKIVILFAGAAGSSKSPIANFLSFKLDLPVLNNDAIRTEVKEDLGKFDQIEYERRRDERLNDIIKSNKSFIYDASIDRIWGEKNSELLEAGYKYYIISLDLSLDFLKRLYAIKSYTESTERFVNDHQKFLESYSSYVNLHITDGDFPNRLLIAYNGVKEWLGKV